MKQSKCLLQCVFLYETSSVYYGHRLLQTVADIKRRSSPTQQRSNPTQVITMQEQGVQTLISISEKSVVMKTQANEYFAAQPLADGLTQTQGRNENTQSHEDDTQGQQNDTQSRYHQKKRTYVQAMDSFSFSPAHTQRTQDNPSEDMPVMPRRKSERLSTDLLLIGGDEDAGSGVHTGGIETNAGDDDDAFGILREIHREKLGKESGHSSDDVYVSPSPGIGANSPVVATLSPIVDSPSNHQNVIDLSPEILHSDPDDSEDYMPMPKNTSVKSEDTKEQKSRDFLARFASPVEPTASALPHSVPSGFMDLNFGDRKLKPELLRQLAEHCGLWASKNVSLVTLRIELQKIQTYFQSVLSPDQPDK